MVGLTLFYEGSDSLPKLQTVHGLHHLRSSSESDCKNVTTWARLWYLL